MDIEFRLIDGPAPGGEIRALDLARISGALHEIGIRFGRDRAAQRRPGRSSRPVEELCEVRLAGLRDGSTRLTYAVGPPEALPLDLEDTRWLSGELDRVLSGLATDTRPDEVPDLVADSVADLAQALKVAARRVDLSVGELSKASFDTSAINPDTWKSPTRRQKDERVAFVGQLEKVDLHVGAFRVRDSVGHTLDLDPPDDPMSWARLIGQWVRASGIAVVNREGELVGLAAAHLEPHELPEGVVLGAPPNRSLEEILASAPGPDPNIVGIDLSDEEWDEFMRALGRA